MDSSYADEGGPAQQGRTGEMGIRVTTGSEMHSIGSVRTGVTEKAVGAILTD